MWWAKGCPGSDLEQHLATLRDEGYCDEALEIERKEGEALRADGYVALDDWKVVTVFSACSWSYAPHGLAGRAPIGITAPEVLAVCQLLRIPAREWNEVFMGVRWMVNAALPLMQPKEQ